MKRIVQNTLHALSRSEKRRLWQLVAANTAMSLVDIASLAALFYIIAHYPGRLDYMLIFFSFFALKSVAGFLLLEQQYKFVYNVASRISERNLLFYLEGKYTEFVDIDSSVQVRKISQQPIEFAHYVLAGLQQILTEAVLIIFSIAAILVFNAKLFGILLLVLAPALLLVGRLIRRRLSSVRSNVKESGEKA